MVRRASSETFSRVLEVLGSLDDGILPIDLRAYLDAIADLTEQDATSAPLKSHYDVDSTTLRTTLVAQNVELRKHKHALSRQDTAYSDLLGRFHDELESYLTEALIDPHSLYLSEILMYDLKSPHNEVFTPKPRFAMERALSSPHDYLNCSCCAKSHPNEEAGVCWHCSQPFSTLN
jgi:origin recognition complex subunit 3